MKNQDLKSVVNQLCGVLNRHIQFVPTKDADPADCYHITGHLKDDLQAVAQHILQCDPGLARRYSSTSVVEGLLEAVEAVLKADTIKAVSPQLELLLHELEKADQHKRCLIPLRGIELTEPVFRVGRFTVKQMDEAALSSVVTLMRNVTGNMNYSDEQKEKWNQHWSRLLNEDLGGRVCLEVEVDADSERAEERAVEEAERLLSLLRFLATRLYPKGEVAIGFEGDGKSGIRRRFIIPLSGHGFRLQQVRIGVSQGLRLDERAAQTMSRLGISQLAAVQLGTETDLEKAILKAIHWISEAHNQDNEDNELICLIIANEALFATGDHSPGTKALAEASAILLEDTYERRLQIVEFVLGAFKLRGRILHEGAAGEKFRYMREFRAVLIGLTSKLISLRGKYTHPAAVLDWVYRQKLEPK